MTEKEKGAPRPLVVKGEDFRQIYVTGAVGNFTPFDYRLLFYTHVAQLPDEAKAVTTYPVPQVFQAEIVMSESVAKQLRDLLDRQIKEREKQPKKTEE